jgi:hypothetical protein
LGVNLACYIQIVRLLKLANNIGCSRSPDAVNRDIIAFLRQCGLNAFYLRLVDAVVSALIPACVCMAGFALARVSVPPAAITAPLAKTTAPTVSIKVCIVFFITTSFFV